MYISIYLAPKSVWHQTGSNCPVCLLFVEGSFNPRLVNRAPSGSTMRCKSFDFSLPKTKRRTVATIEWISKQSGSHNRWHEWLNLVWSSSRLCTWNGNMLPLRDWRAFVWISTGHPFSHNTFCCAGSKVGSIKISTFELCMCMPLCHFN